MSLVGFKGKNHPQQVGKVGAKDQVDDRGTPPELFDPLMKRFDFTLDAAAALHNAKCERFFTLADNGLEQSWNAERVWCNPPYSDIRPWVEKAWREWRSPDEFESPDLIVMLLPANRTEQNWWQDLVEPYRDGRGPLKNIERDGLCVRRDCHQMRVEFIRGRQRFIMPGQTDVLPNQRPPFGVCLLIWSASVSPSQEKPK